MKFNEKLPRVGEKIRVHSSRELVEGIVHHIGDECVHVFHNGAPGKWFTKKAQHNCYRASMAFKKDSSQVWDYLTASKVKEEAKHSKPLQNGNKKSIIEVRSRVEIVG